MKVYILDDEQKAITTLQFLLSEYFQDIEVCGFSTNIEEARKEIIKQKPDILFLDISMPIENGLEFAQTIKQTGSLIVFVTAHPNHAIEAFMVNAFGYLLKPVQLKELQYVITNARQKVTERKTHSLPSRIKIKYEGKTVLLATDNILYVSSEGNYSKIHLADGKPITLTKNIKYLEDTYFNNPPFLRIHQSYLVNLEKVAQYSAAELIITGGTELPVSRQRKDLFLQLMETR